MLLRLFAGSALALGLLCSFVPARQGACTGCNATALLVSSANGGGCSLGVKWTVFMVDGNCVGTKPVCFSSPCEFELWGEYQSCCAANRLQWTCDSIPSNMPVGPSCGTWSQFTHCFVTLNCGHDAWDYAKISSNGSWVQRDVFMSCSDCR